MISSVKNVDFTAQFIYNNTEMYRNSMMATKTQYLKMSKEAAFACKDGRKRKGN